MDRDFRKKVIAGLFFIVGIVLVFFVIFTIGSDKGLTQPKFQVNVLFKNVGGLIEGAPVQLSGVNVGNVNSIDFLEKEKDGRLVQVKLNIFKKYRKQLEGNAHFAITTEGVLGGKLVKITVINDGQKIDLSQPIIGGDPIDVEDLAEVFEGAVESFTKTSDRLGDLNLQKLSKDMSTTAESLTVTTEGINAILIELDYITKKARRLLDRIEQRVIDGNLFKVF